MRSIFLVLFSFFFCGSIFPQVESMDAVLAYIHSDISKFSENSIQENLGCTQMPSELSAFFEKGLPMSRGAFPKNTVTFVQEGFAGQDYYTFLATRFSPQIISDSEVRKQIVFLDFPDILSGFEIRIYQIFAENADPEKKIYWKNTTDPYYRPFLPEE